jgi:hypothetical protein
MKFELYQWVAVNDGGAFYVGMVRKITIETGATSIYLRFGPSDDWTKYDQDDSRLMIVTVMNGDVEVVD